MRFTRQDRLLKSEDFRKVFTTTLSANKGKVFRDSYFIAYCSMESERPRLGMSISKKVVRKAANRNRIKRCWREYFRQNKDRFSGEIILRCIKEPPVYSSRTLNKLLTKVTDCASR